MVLFSIKYLYLDYFQMVLRIFWEDAICSLLQFLISSHFLLKQHDFSNLTPLPQPWPAVTNYFSSALWGFWQTFSAVSVSERTAATSVMGLHSSWHTWVLISQGIIFSLWMTIQIFVMILRCVWAFNSITKQCQGDCFTAHPDKTECKHFPSYVFKLLPEQCLWWVLCCSNAVGVEWLQIW